MNLSQALVYPDTFGKKAGKRSRVGSFAFAKITAVLESIATMVKLYEILLIPFPDTQNEVEEFL